MIDWIVHWPTWELMRVIGFGSYMLIAAGICLGILYSFPAAKPQTKKTRYRLHTLFTNAGMALGLAHGLLPVISIYSPFAWKEVLVPFAAVHHPVLNGLGTLAAYGAIVLVFSSDFRHKIAKKLWYASHLLAYPVFAATFVHGYFLGSDTKLLAIRWMYLLSIAMIVTLTAVRFAIVPQWKAAGMQRKVKRTGA